MDDASVAAVVGQFAIYGEFEGAASFGGGHINDTFVSVWSQAGARVRYVHQRINSQVFRRPDQVMENIERVTSHIRGKLKAAGERGWARRTLTVVPAADGKLWARDSAGGWWRTYLFVEGSRTAGVASSPDEARFLGASIGRFQKDLADLPPPRLHESIPDFHNMEKRYLRFYGALSADSEGRAAGAAAETAFMRENEGRGGVLVRAIREGRIPERITHNDTKMNNILIDDADSRALCVIDLDTVMPGTSLFDVGDLIRTVATRAAEDERDLPAVVFDPVFFRALIAGYFSEARSFLTEGEAALVAESGRNLTHIMALRFLTDYLEGDHYYHTARPGHNLDRCRNQIALVRSMDAQWDAALETVRSLWAG